VLAAWSLGIMVSVLLSPLVLWCGLMAAIAVGVGLFRHRLAVLAGLALVASLMGAGRAALSATVQLPPGLHDQTIAISGTVDDDPVERRASRRVVVRLDHLVTGAGQTRTDLRIVATVYGITPLHYGDRVLLTGQLQEPPRFDQFDYRAYLAEQGIAGVMASARLVRVVAGSGDPFHAVLFALRRALIQTVDRALPEPQAALLLGVVFGYRATLAPLLQQQMIASGLVHIVVASGLNVALVARLVQQGLQRIWPAGAAIVALISIAGYALLSGASPAALRATVMGALVIIAGMLRRDSRVFVSMAIAAALMLGIKPDLVRDVGFQLSFAATLGIVTWADPIAHRLAFLPGALRDALAATLAAQAVSWPLLLAQVHQVSLIAPLANLLVVPLVPFMMVAGAAGAAAGTILPAAGWLPLQAAGAVGRWMEAVIQVTGSLPFAALTTPYFPTRWFVAAAILNGGALAGVKLRRFFWQKRVWAVLGAAGLLAITLLLIRPDGQVHVYALDVGTGSAVLVRTANGHQILIDAGPDADRFAQATGRVLPPTARTIDIWLITGGRRANVGAATAVLTRFRVRTIEVADPDPWSASLRGLVQQAQSAGIPVGSGNRPVGLDGITVSAAADGRSWLIQAGRAAVAVVLPETSWTSLPPSVDGAIFTSGGPTAWQGPGQGFSAIQVAANSRDGLPVRAFLRALAGAGVYRTDRLGTVELLARDGGFAVAG
jgi:competence protein ComEC